MKRREFVTSLGGAGVAWPYVARAQRLEQIIRIAVLTNLSEHDVEGQTLLAAFQQRTQELGWIEGRNIQIEYRSTVGSTDVARARARELVGMRPSVILAIGGTALSALMQETRSIPIVFVAAADPVQLGYVASLARPGGNATGFTAFERVMGPKWLEMLKEIAPTITRVLILDPKNPASDLLLPSIKSAAPLLGLQLVIEEVHNAAEIEKAIDAMAHEPNLGLLIAGSSLATVNRDLIIARAARYRLPAAYSDSVFPRSGGLFSYAVDRKDDYRKAASYIDRILRGDKPGELPVQTPTKFELVINRKTANALGLTIPVTLLVLSDEVID